MDPNLRLGKMTIYELIRRIDSDRRFVEIHRDACTRLRNVLEKQLFFIEQEEDATIIHHPKKECSTSENLKS